ncbi:MAG: caspase family protein [Pseudomonadota bacterium]
MSRIRSLAGLRVMHSWWPGASATAFVLCCVLALTAANKGTAAEPGRDGDALLIVDCALPAQVRQLGTAMTYLAPRRATKTTASDCAIRGGEYVAYDRASLATALKVWLPQAEAGDQAARTNVGEIYEKGIGAAPDYASAAKWYQMAADQGYGRALTNLGFLYERGLGVAKDPVAALKLYRKATGIEGTISLEGDTSHVTKEEIDALRKELERTRQELDKSRRLLDENRLKSSREIERLLMQKQQAAAAGNADETRRLETLLKARESELARQKDNIERLEGEVGNYKVKLATFDGTRQELDETRRLLDENRKKSAQEIERLLAQKQQAAAAGNTAETRRLETLLKTRETELARQKADIERLEGEVGNYKARVAKLETVQEPRRQAAAAAAVAAPSIQIIDPQVVITRDTITVKVRAGVRTREIVGRVSAPAGLMSLTANDVSQSVDNNGMFKTVVELGAGKTKVALLAVDRQGKVSQLQFFLEEDARNAAPTAVAPPKLPSFNTGNYYALVIGNQKYTKLQPLETPEADVTDLVPVLRDNYGFKVTLLLNATRYQILTEMNNMRAKLTEKDNLLIYYAGHGELDRVNGLANWLPIDAEPTSNANWISSSSLTEMLNAMAAKHILVVADSCYSGALTRSSVGQLQTGLTDEARLDWLKQIAAARSRTALTSGGLKPVMDGGGGKYSVFASIFIDILSQNQDVLEGMRLYREISARVVNIALKQKFEQRPEYGAIRFAGGDSGDFLFVPKH